MKKTTAAYIGLMLLLTAVFALAAEQPVKGRLQFVIDSFNNDQGRAILVLYRRSDKLFGLQTAFRKAVVEIVNGQARASFEDVPAGEYAAIAVHDENNNGVVEHHWYGLPKEQVGFSNNFKLSILSGKPNFDKLAFTFTGTDTELAIHLRK